MIRILRIQ